MVQLPWVMKGVGQSSEEEGEGEEVHPFGVKGEQTLRVGEEEGEGEGEGLSNSLL